MTTTLPELAHQFKQSIQIVSTWTHNIMAANDLTLLALLKLTDEMHRFSEHLEGGGCGKK